MNTQPLLTNDATVLGLLMLTLAVIFYTASLPHRFWQKFYTFFPPLLLCYFIPGLYNSFGFISGDTSKLYGVVSQYFLPATLVYFTLGMDVKAIARLGGKALVVFLAGTVGVMLGGPVAMALVQSISPQTTSGEGADAVWRGMATIAGSWIGGGANQTALKEVFQPSDKLFSQVIAVDVIIAELWMGVLIYGASISQKIDAFFKADSAAVEEVKNKLEQDSLAGQRIATTKDWIFIAAIGFGATGLAHWCADYIAPFIELHYPNLKKFSLTSSFFWVVSLVTLLGITLSFTKLRSYEHVGASKLGSVFLYVLVATIGMKMNILAIADNPGLFAIGILWMSIHISVMLLAAKIVRAPFFFTATGSMANVGGAASAPVVAAAFHPSLAPVGVILAILGYALGTYCGYLTGLMMQWVTT